MGGALVSLFPKFKISPDMTANPANPANLPAQASNDKVPGLSGVQLIAANPPLSEPGPALPVFSLLPR
jgi:hypothetical protein